MKQEQATIRCMYVCMYVCMYGYQQPLQMFQEATYCTAGSPCCTYHKLCAVHTLSITA